MYAYTALLLVILTYGMETTIASVSLQAESAERQGKLITDHQESALVNLFLIQPISHCITTQVHEGGRLQQDNLSSLERSLGNETISLILKMNIGRFSVEELSARTGVDEDKISQSMMASV